MRCEAVTAAPLQSRPRAAAVAPEPAPEPARDRVELVAQGLGRTCQAAALVTAARIGLQIAAAPGIAGKVAAGAMTLGAAAAGLVAADFASGVFHWSVDNYPNADTPLIGSTARSFQDHHRSSGMDETSVWKNILPSTAVFTAPMVGLAAFTPHYGLAAFGLAFTGGGVLAQASHRWAHMQNPPGLARVLQKLRVSQSAENHDRHHQAPFDEHYCIVNGSLNGILARTNFWRHAERGVYKLTGAEPRSWEDPIVKEMALGKLSRAEALERRSVG